MNFSAIKKTRVGVIEFREFRNGGTLSKKVIDCNLTSENIFFLKKVHNVVYKHSVAMATVWKS